MKKFIVEGSVPVSFSYEIEAVSEEAAKKKAFNKFDDEVSCFGEEKHLDEGSISWIRESE